MELTRAEKYRQTAIAKHGSEEAWKEHQRQVGAKARRDTPRGFAVMDKDKVKEISQRGHEIRWSKNRQSPS